MKNQFVIVNLSSELEEIGFREECASAYIRGTDIPYPMYRPYMYKEQSDELLRPTWQQVFDWFRIKHNIWLCIDWTQEMNETVYLYRIDKYLGKFDKYLFKSGFKTYEQARLECIIQSIEIVRKRNAFIKQLMSFIEDTKETGQPSDFERKNKYIDFTKKELKINMFICCDKDDKPLPYPSLYDPRSKTGLYDIEEIDKAEIDYNHASNNIIFGGFKISKQDESMIEIKSDNLVLKYSKDDKKFTINESHILENIGDLLSLTELIPIKKSIEEDFNIE